MKTITFLFMICISYLNSQVKTDSLTQEISYRKVFETELDKSKIKSFSKKWVAVNFKDSNQVIKVDDENNLLAKGFFKINTKVNGISVPMSIDFVIDIAFKENKYKIEFYNLKQYATQMPDVKSEVLDMTNMDIEVFIENYKKAIESMPDGTPGKKLALKRADSKSKMEKDFKQSQKIQSKTINSIKSELEATAKSLENFISKSKSKSDW